MKRTILISLFFLMVGQMTILAQKKIKCVVTTQSGTEITGTIKRHYLSFPVTQGFHLYKGKEKIWMYPNLLHRVIILDSIEYLSLPNRKGDMNLMQILVDGFPLLLCRNSTRNVG